MAERLDKLIATYGNMSRREAIALIRRGRVTVDGAVCRQPDQKADGDTQQLAVDETPLRTQRYVYIELNKPMGVLCVSRDPKAKTVIDLLPPELRRKGLFPAGRLDKDTVGLVLITDDGEYAHRILSPKKAVFKRYHAVVDGPVTAEHVRLFAEGTTLRDGTRCLSAGLTLLTKTEKFHNLSAKYQLSFPADASFVEVRIQEGRYHQIKRMFESVDRKILWLQRISMGGLELDERLAEGESRLLNPAEIASVLE